VSIAKGLGRLLKLLLLVVCAAVAGKKAQDAYVVRARKRLELGFGADVPDGLGLELLAELQ
jgi:hypothetical protein